MSAIATSKFKPGDRIVYTSFGGEYRAIGGTVIEVEERPHPSGVFPGVNWYLHVILDTAQEVHDEQAAFYLESEYDPHVPF